MVAEQLRTVFGSVFEVCVVASNSPDEGLPADEGPPADGGPPADDRLPANERGNQHADLPSHPGGTGRPPHSEARAELRDRETYYAELRFAVHCQSRSIPVPRPALDDEGLTWGHGTSAQRAQPDRADQARITEDRDIEGESWDEIIARFGDTCT
jgi:hypothetical protein